MKKHDCGDHLDTVIRKGRARYACSVCGADVSLMWFFWMEATSSDTQKYQA
jgi:hypothetical protein